MKIEDVFWDCAENWAKEKFDERIGEAIDRFGEWSKDLSSEEEEILCEFIKRFRYYTAEKINNILLELNDNAIRDYSISDDNSVICPVRKHDGRRNSSHEYWNTHAKLCGLSNGIYIDDVTCISDNDWNSVENIIFVDDCSGTGTQFTDFLKRTQKSFSAGKTSKSLKDKQIILIVVQVIEDALEKIQMYAKENEITIRVVYFYAEKKAFYNRTNEDRKIIKQLSDKRNVGECFGKYNAEALMAFYNNTPNDTIGIFQYETEKNNALFPRTTTISREKMRQNKKERECSLYETKC